MAIFEEEYFSELKRRSLSYVFSEITVFFHIYITESQNTAVLSKTYATFTVTCQCGTFPFTHSVCLRSEKSRLSYRESPLTPLLAPSCRTGLSQLCANCSISFTCWEGRPKLCSQHLSCVGRKSMTSRTSCNFRFTSIPSTHGLALPSVLTACWQQLPCCMQCDGAHRCCDNPRTVFTLLFRSPPTVIEGYMVLLEACLLYTSISCYKITLFVTI